MAELAAAQGKDAEAREYRGRERAARRAFQEKLFDAAQGLYRDGEGTGHASLHASLFPLAVGLVPAERRPAVARWLEERGMACSVYAGQYLLEALFEHGADRRALELITPPTDRGSTGSPSRRRATAHGGRWRRTSRGAYSSRSGDPRISHGATCPSTGPSAASTIWSKIGVLSPARLAAGDKPSRMSSMDCIALTGRGPIWPGPCNEGGQRRRRRRGQRRPT